jgi:hypothetical protein
MNFLDALLLSLEIIYFHDFVIFQDHVFTYLGIIFRNDTMEPIRLFESE